MKVYNKELNYSYSYGAFSTIELINNRTDHVKEVYYSKRANEGLVNRLHELCSEKHIKLIESDLDFFKITQKKNTFVIGVFYKYESKISNGKHIVLLHADDYGNLGTIIRTALGYGFNDIALISPQIDTFNPKVIRSSMGAIFSINTSVFDSLESYMNLYDDRDIFTFYNEAQSRLKDIKNTSKKFSLVFPNNKNDLDPIYKTRTKPLFIKTSKAVDSLDITITVSLALNHFK